MPQTEWLPLIKLGLKMATFGEAREVLLIMVYSTGTVNR